MLQQILTDMYIDPDMLNALNEDQKKTLFLKMRQEQVRRWKEREEGGGDDRDGEGKRAAPRKANRKSVSWLLGHDGDVAVIVIGELDELSSKFICSGFGEKKTPSLQNTAHHQPVLKSWRQNTEPVRTESENLPPNTQPGISLSLKGKCEETSASLPLPVSVSAHPSSPPETEKPEPKPPGGTGETSLAPPQPSICSRLLARANQVTVRPAAAAVAPGSINARLDPATLSPTATATPTPTPRSTVRMDSGIAKGGLHSQEAQKAPEPLKGKDIGASDASRGAGSEEAGSSGGAPTSAGRGRVAQLMKTFSTDSGPTPTLTPPPRGVKPPLANKPGHLRLTSTPTVR
ncbi:protein VASP homolog [Pseudoliparis swirei]|uniref:protein VASP homolog n=1 Tax=Pseudoliparis swirei TaxID=2059687 RepID=UPI0024BD5D91|nr:protein VASP homolog [Pseudoliparis swirei]XP_056262659.1 protein VASP homolog [Pseudoliparis swirei]XP_056262667.1 protein VASP homolog [Pseudoliparis swirei]XP_056262677.1 protein VASP homolog [Pseudoliparis swirei]